jgi:NAD(P)H-hydrate epimerase
MKIFSTDEINAIRQYTLREQGITELQFIETVSENLALEIITTIIPGHRLVVFAGPDVNGAYALCTSRHLCLQGFNPRVYLFNVGGNRLSADCRAARDRLVEECGEEVLVEVTGVRFAMPDLQGECTVIDGLFGSERTTPLSGGYQGVVRHINEMAPRVVSIDTPSGLLVDSIEGMINRNIIHATITLAIGMPRVAFFMKENAELLGTWKVIPVDFSQAAIDKAPWNFRLIEKSDIKMLLPRREAFASKADFGDAILFAGSYGMAGAAVLAARGALRGGAGKVTVHGPRCGYFILQAAEPCAIYDTDSGDTAITEIELKRDFRAVAIGPGIGTADSTIDALASFLKLANANSRPLVLDADALNCIAIRPDMLNHVPVMSVLTPHAGEFDRLFGRQPSSYARLLKALEVAESRQVIIVLKGRFTAIVRPDGKVYFNPTGSPALATGGTGDVLTGVMAAFIAQGLRPELAAIAAPYVHGLAGEFAAQQHGTYGTTATDVADQIGRAIKSIIE